MTPSAFTGTYSYRALHNDPDLDRTFGDLRFATGRMDLRETAHGQVEGRVTGEGWGTWTDWFLNLRGQCFFGEPYSILLRGTNLIAEETWIYDYRGYLMPRWPGADGERDVIVGSVIRSSSRKLHDAQAGLFASFYAVRRAD